MTLLSSILLSAFTFFVGAAFGSFLNVVIFRLPKGEDIFKKRSYCPHCKKPISTFDLIPIFSFFVLLGKCRKCGKPISVQYPAVELVTACLFLASFLLWQAKFGLSWQFIPQLLHYFLIVSVLIGVFVIDAKLGIIPDKIVKFALIISALLILATYLGDFLSIYLGLVKTAPELSKYFFPSLFVNQAKFAGLDFGIRLLAGVFVSILFTGLILVTAGRGMGWGDVKLGFWLGFAFSFPQTFLVLFLSFVTGAAVSIVLILSGRKKFGQTIPFGPFLAAGAAISLFAGDLILVWYLGSLQ